MSTALTKYQPYCHLFTATEELIIEAALRNSNFALVSKIYWDALVRSMAIPKHLIDGASSNYSACRLY
jgi:hypothetical protein